MNVIIATVKPWNNIPVCRDLLTLASLSLEGYISSQITEYSLKRSVYEHNEPIYIVEGFLSLQNYNGNPVNECT